MTVLKKSINNPFILFGFLWVLLCVLYLPTVKAGFVADFSGWLEQLKGYTFWQYLNRLNSKIKSLYHFTQFTTYIFYKLFGLHVWMWFLLHITLQAINSFLLYKFFRNVFVDSGINNAAFIALGGTILFCVCPHISEVVVWKPAYHYLQGFLFILLILLWVQKYHYEQNIKYAWWSGIIYLISTYSLEIFYLTPWFVLATCLYYRIVLNYNNAILKKVFLYFFLPQLAFFLLHLVVYRIVFNDWVSHIGTDAMTTNPYYFFLSKPLKYIFHIYFLGRFFNPAIRDHVYQFSESNTGIILFYILLITSCILVLLRFRNMSRKAKTVVFVFVLVLISVSLLIPLGFPPLLLVYGDRYSYVLNAFSYMLVALCGSFITKRSVAVLLWSIYVAINIFFTSVINIYWKHAAYVTNRLLSTFPYPESKTAILLDLPDNMQGIPMIYASNIGSFKSLYNVTMPHKLTNTVYDAVSFNMLGVNDGAHVTVLDDSTVRVTLNQWGTWWWYNNLGAGSYENKDYKLKMIDPGHMYELTLKYPHTKYALFYQQGGVWKQVNWNIRNTDQY